MFSKWNMFRKLVLDAVAQFATDDILYFITGAVSHLVQVGKRDGQILPVSKACQKLRAD